MVGIGEVGAGFSSLVAIKNLIQGLNAANMQTSINEIKIELQGHIIEAQAALSTAHEKQALATQRVAQLEQQIADMENWEAEQGRYEIKAIDVGAFAYMHKPGMESGEPAMWLCQTCFEDCHKSPLQYRGQLQAAGHTGGRGMQSSWGCNRCDAVVTVSYRRDPSTPYRPNA